MNPSVNILIVDDDPKSLMALEALLTGPERVIFKAESGREALRYLLKTDFALILMDVRMPVMDGFETAALIRKREQSKNTPIIFVSAVSTLDSDVTKGVSLGAIDYIFKPIDPRALKLKVSLILNLFNYKTNSSTISPSRPQPPASLPGEAVQSNSTYHKEL
jgi:DNA-binding response OmpR family regulator